jgi:hypothetical protein
MHFTYDNERFSTIELMQGDVLRRTPELDGVLETVHPHFYQHPKNLYFLVLTQSCDLVPRRPTNICKAPYIAIAPVRSLELVIERQVAQYRSADVRSDLPVIGTKAKTKISEFLGRLLNNNEPGFFYLDSEGTDLATDCVAFLNLSIAIKTELHLNTCIAAKMLQLTDTFQAKLGWLVGQMYSRVGTQDMDYSRSTKKISDALKSVALWIDDAAIKAIEQKFEEIQDAEPGKQISEREITAAVRAIPSLKDQVMNRATEVLKATLGDSDAQAATVRKLASRLRSDAALTKLLQR